MRMKGVSNVDRKTTKVVRSDHHLIGKVALQLIAACACQSAALGQTASGTMETGTLIPKARAGGYYSRSTDVRMIMHQFATCTYQLSPGRVEKMLMLPFGSAPYKSIFSSVVVDDCLGVGTLSFAGALLRGALFEQLYWHDFARSGPDDFSKVEPLNYGMAYASPISSDQGNVIALGRFGDCVARADGHDAKQLILNNPDAVGETVAITGLTANLAACVPAGQQIHFSRSTLRAAVAEGLYRLSRATQGRAWGAADQRP